MKATTVARLVTLLVIAVCAASCSSCTAPGPGASESDEPLRVAWLNQGLAGSEAWTRAHEAAFAATTEHFGDRIEGEFLYEINPATNADEQITALVDGGIDLIFATSFPLNDPMVAAAGQHPDVLFNQARGVEILPNLGTFSGADEEPIYLAGMAAALTSTTGNLGFIATVPEPETLRHVNAYTLGAQAIDPTVTVELQWIGSWWDPVTEAALADQMYDNGVDVIATGSIGSVVGDSADARGMHWIGHDSDLASEYPETWLTAAVPDWTAYYIEEIERAIGDDWDSRLYYGDMSDGFTDIATLGDSVLPDHVAQLMATRDEFLSGSIDVFTGPIIDQNGTTVVAAGATLTVNELLAIDWLVQGVSGGASGR